MKVLEFSKTNSLISEDKFNARIVSKKNGDHLSIVTFLNEKEHLIEFKVDYLSYRLLVNRIEVAQYGVMASLTSGFLWGLTLGLINTNKKSFNFNLSDGNQDYPSSLKLTLGLSDSFSQIDFKVNGITLIKE